jgi:hypothetical protein
MNVVLHPGKYFALFTPFSETDEGYVLGSAGTFLAGLVNLGTFDPTGARFTSPFASQQYAAVTVRGEALGK